MSLKTICSFNSPVFIFKCGSKQFVTYSHYIKMNSALINCKGAINTNNFILKSFTLYPAHSRVGRGHLVLIHSVTLFPPCFGGIGCRIASTPEQRNKHINANKYFISSNGDRTHNQWILQSHFAPLCTTHCTTTGLNIQLLLQ